MISINFLLIALLLAGFTTALLIIEIRKNQNAKIKELEERITKLEKADRARMPYTLRRKVEDVMTTVASYRFQKEDIDRLLETLTNQLGELHTPTKK